MAEGETLVGAIDLGGTKTVVAVVDAAGRVLRHRRLQTPSRPQPDALLALLTSELQALTAELPRIAAVGAALPGPVDGARGILHRAFDWDWHEVPVAQWLAHALGVPAAADNDVHCCCRAEQCFGVARGVDDFAWVQVSTGVGGALVLGGRLYGGAEGWAGEIGHIVLEEGGPRCACGRQGCLQALVSGPAIVRRYAAARAGDTPAGGAEAVFAAAARGERVAQELIAAVATDLGRGLAVLVTLLNPALVVLGGGVMASLRPYLGLVDAALRARVFGESNARVRLAATAVGYEAPLLGAAVLAQEAARRQGSDATGA